MCGRVILDKEGEQILQRYFDPQDFKRIKTGEVFPSDMIPVRTRNHSYVVRWGLKPEWSKGTIINARLETIQSKPFFKDAFMHHRCVVMTSSYFEWSKDNQEHRKYRISSAAPMIYLAGILKEDKEELCAVILTEPAQHDIEWLHDRMPVILNRAEARDYLNGSDCVLHRKSQHHFSVAEV